MQIFHNRKEISGFCGNLKSELKSIGLVPTMGALHEGHLALVKTALSENSQVIVSIFVNPTQFDKEEDLKNYPRTLESDIDLLKTVSESEIHVYAPSVDDIYGTQINSKKFDFNGLENEMEGKFRKGHFDGVGTVVARLLKIIEPDRAYFGEKDFQQLAIIKKLVETENIPVEIVPCEIYRAEDGLAMSSRNIRLTPQHRQEAPFIYETLKAAKKKFGTESAEMVGEWVKNKFKENSFLQLEYFVIADIEDLKPILRKSNKKKYRAFIAAYAGDIRLIDNIALN